MKHNIDKTSNVWTGKLHLVRNIDHERKTKTKEKVWNNWLKLDWAGGKGERKVIMATNAAGQETVSENFCLGFGVTQPSILHL